MASILSAKTVRSILRREMTRVQAEDKMNVPQRMISWMPYYLNRLNGPTNYVQVLEHGTRATLYGSIFKRRKTR